VCACDGKLYCNACAAHKEGIDDVTTDTCKRTPDAGTGADCNNDNDCRTGLKCCNVNTPGPGNTKQCTMPTPQGDCPP
jgi:hypothetical protein